MIMMKELGSTLTLTTIVAQILKAVPLVLSQLSSAQSALACKQSAVRDLNATNRVNTEDRDLGALD